MALSTVWTCNNTHRSPPSYIPSTDLQYTCQAFYIYRRDIFYLKSAKIFRRGPIISEDVRRRSEDFQRCYAEFHLTEHRNTKEH